MVNNTQRILLWDCPHCSAVNKVTSTAVRYKGSMVYTCGECKRTKTAREIERYAGPVNSHV